MRPDKDLIDEHLEHPVFSIIGKVADEKNQPCYVIGGYVRDIFLYRESKDIDIVTVGSGIELATAVSRKMGKGVHLSVFKNFGTAQVKAKDLEVELWERVRNRIKGIPVNRLWKTVRSKMTRTDGILRSMLLHYV